MKKKSASKKSGDAKPACLERNGSTSSLTRYQRDVLRSAEKNHMWLNAFACIRPTDELKRQIGEWVLRQLNEPLACIQADYDDGPLKDLKQPEAILRFNKS